MKSAMLYIFALIISASLYHQTKDFGTAALGGIFVMTYFILDEIIKCKNSR